MPYYIEYDPTQPVGKRLAPEVIAEIVANSPSIVDAGSIKSIHLADNAVTTAKLALGAVGSPQIATNGVQAVNVQAGAITTPKLADNAVTLDKTAAGVYDVVDSSGAAVQRTVKEVTAAEYAAIASPDPNIEYHIYG